MAMTAILPDPPASSLPPRSEARFVTGSTMRHVVVMAMTGSLGLMFMFLVDAAAVFWVAQLKQDMLVAALGFAWTIQFFTVSVGIGLMVGALALVSRAFGAGQVDEGRATATTAMVLTAVVQTVVATLVLLYRVELLTLCGASGETLQIASRFLTVSVPSLPIMAVGIVATAVLRAAGDAWRAMAVTLSAGIVAMVLDPLLIIWAGWGIEGAAIVVAISRVTTAIVGLYFVVLVRDLAGPATLAHARRMARPFLAIALPAVLTQLASPFGNYLMTSSVAKFGDSAVAGWAVVARIMIFSFGGLFALSGAVGGILGQNYGAGRLDRVRAAYRDSLIYCAAYVGLVWLLLFSVRSIVPDVFQLAGPGAEIARLFLTISSLGFVFLGGLFVASAAFNTLGRPLWSTGFNWLRDAVLLLPLILLLTGEIGATGAIWAQLVATVLAGTVAVIAGWLFVVSLKPLANRATAHTS